jgi:hypothetical protein
MAGFDGRIEGKVTELMSPELNRIARSFQSQIYRVSEDLKKVSPTETDPLSLHLDRANDIGATYTYNVDGTLNTKTMAGVTYTLSYNIDGTLASKTDGTSTWTYNYTDGLLTSKVKS